MASDADKESFDLVCDNVNLKNSIHDKVNLRNSMIEKNRENASMTGNGSTGKWSGKSNPTMGAHLSFIKENKNKCKTNSGPHSPQTGQSGLHHKFSKRPAGLFNLLPIYHPESPSGQQKLKNQKMPIYHSKPPLGPSLWRGSPFRSRADVNFCKFWNVLYIW